MTSTLEMSEMPTGLDRRDEKQEPRRRAALAAQLLGALLVVSSVFVAFFASDAGATSLSNGQVALTSTSGKAVATNPLANRQLIGVVVGPNSTLARSSLESAGYPSGATPIKVAECADPGGLSGNLPKKPSGCEPLTVQSTSHIEANGSVRMDYTVYALPDITDLGATTGIVCDNGQNQCVLGIFSNQNDFTKPHIFSAPFLITAESATNTPVSGDVKSSTTPNTISSSVAVPPATLAFTGSPVIWPWLLGSGVLLLVVGTVLRVASRRRTQ